MKKLVHVIAFSGLLGVGLSGGIINAAETPVVIKAQTAWGKNLPVLSLPYQIFPKVKRMTAGNLTVKLIDPNKVVPTLEMLDAVSEGMLDAAFTTPGYHTGKMPTAAFFTAIPFGPENAEFIAWVKQGGGAELWQKMLDKHNYNVHTVYPCLMIAPETSGWFRKPIDGPADLIGLKMRFFGLGGEVMKKLGVSTTLLGAADIYPALERGTIDATEFSMPAIDEKLGFARIAKYNYYPGWHQQSSLGELLVNKDIWNRLSQGQKEMLETTCDATSLQTLAVGEDLQPKAITQTAKKYGVTSLYWSDEMLALFHDKWKEVVAEHVAADPEFKEVWDSYSAYRKQYSEWALRAYLPRKTLRDTLSD